MENIIPLGYCQCGCGEKTTIAKQTSRAEGVIKGQPKRYIIGHSRRLSPVDYLIEDRGHETPCWIWQKAVSDGYGIKIVNGQNRYAHRVYYEQAYGPIPQELQIDHLCRQRSCCNYEHLEAVTHAENGRRGASAKITHEQARAIKALRGADVEADEVGKRYDIQGKTVREIWRGLHWADV